VEFLSRRDQLPDGVVYPVRPFMEGFVFKLLQLAIRLSDRPRLCSVVFEQAEDFRVVGRTGTGHQCPPDLRERIFGI